MSAFSSRNFAAGVLFFLLGIAAIILGWDLTRGHASRMGPGYFPMLLSYLLTGIGALIMIRAAPDPGERIGGWHWKRNTQILGAIAVFALLIETAGLAVAAVAIIVISASAAPDRRWQEILMLAACLTAACVALFVLMLGLPIRIWP